MDVDRDLQIRVRADEDSPSYHDVEAYLRRARDTNRGEDVRRKDVSIITQDPKHPRQRIFGWTRKKEGSNEAHFGEAYKSIEPSMNSRKRSPSHAQRPPARVCGRARGQAAREVFESELTVAQKRFNEAQPEPGALRGAPRRILA